jgi:hypothetical protein
MRSRRRRSAKSIRAVVRVAADRVPPLLDADDRGGFDGGRLRDRIAPAIGLEPLNATPLSVPREPWITAQPPEIPSRILVAAPLMRPGIARKTVTASPNAATIRYCAAPSVAISPLLENTRSAALPGDTVTRWDTRRQGSRPRSS